MKPPFILPYPGAMSNQKTKCGDQPSSLLRIWLTLTIIKGDNKHMLHFFLFSFLSSLLFCLSDVMQKRKKMSGMANLIFFRLLSALDQTFSNNLFRNLKINCNIAKIFLVMVIFSRFSFMPPKRINEFRCKCDHCIRFFVRFSFL